VKYGKSVSFGDELISGPDAAKVEEIISVTGEERICFSARVCLP